MEFVNGILTGLVASIFFWPVVIGAFVWLMYAVDGAKGGQTLITTVLVLGLSFLKWPEVGTFVKDHTFMAIGIYVAVGVVWSLVKWMITVNKMVRQFRVIKDTYSTTNQLDGAYFKTNPSTSHIEGLVRALNQSKSFNMIDWHNVQSMERVVRYITPQVNSNKYKLFTWGLYWPASVVWFLVADAITTFGEFLYARFGNIFQAIADRMVKKAL